MPFDKTGYHRKWYLKNRKRKLIQNSEWQAANPERVKFLSRRWYQKNRSRHLENTRRSRAARKEKSPKVFLDKTRKYGLKWRSKNRARWRYLTNRWRKNNPERIKELLRRHLYGLEPEQYAAMLKGQNKKCKICKQHFRKTPHVDHCKQTGKVRGLLCGSCNLGLGFFKDSVHLLKAAQRYLCR